MTRHLKSILLIVLIAISIFLITKIMNAALNIKTTSEQNYASNETKYRVIIISQEQDNPFWRLLEQGAINASEAYDMTIDYIGPQRNNSEQQLQLLKKAIAASPHGIIVQGMNTTAFNDLVLEAKEMNIPVITVDADAPDSARIAYVGTNQYEAGKKLGQDILKYARTQNNPLKIGVIIGSEDSENQKERLAGLKASLRVSKKAEIVAVHSSDISRIKAADEAVKLLNTHPEINTLVGLSSLDGAGIYDGLARAHQENKAVFAFDKLSITLDLIRRGEIISTIAQQPEQMGERAVHTLIEYINEAAIKDIQFIDTKLLTQATLGE